MNGFAPDPFGGQRAGFSATTQINRRDFGIDSTIPKDGGGVVILLVSDPEGVLD
jgi:polyisoprenoid-binding protein YceI